MNIYLLIGILMLVGMGLSLIYTCVTHYWNTLSENGKVVAMVMAACVLIGIGAVQYYSDARHTDAILKESETKFKFGPAERSISSGDRAVLQFQQDMRNFAKKQAEWQNYQYRAGRLPNDPD